jgi:hypothetical protein
MSFPGEAFTSGKFDRKPEDAGKMYSRTERPLKLPEHRGRRLNHRPWSSAQ